MKAYPATLKWAILILMVMFLSGCGSMRLASTLKPSGETNLPIGNARFSIINYTGVYDKNDPATKIWVDMITQDFLSQRAKTLYPGIFTDEWTALPVMVKAEGVYHDGLTTMTIMAILTAGMIPFPGKTWMDFSVSSDVRTALGESLINRDRKFEVEQAMWMSIIGPLGCIPVPGQADLPRDGIFLFFPLTEDAYSKTKLPTYVADCIVKSVVMDLYEADPALVDTAYKARASHLQEITIDGRTFWSFLAPSLSKEDGRPVAFTAMLYQESPRRGAAPYEQVVVASRDSTGNWIPQTGYLHRTKSLTAVSVLIDNGIPAKVVVRTVEDPSLEDFIELPDLSGADRAQALRWSNGILVEAKNKSLVKILREKTGDQLMSLATRIEKTILDLSGMAERAKDNAQAMVEKGEGDPASERELSVLFRQRIEVLKPILAAMKDAAARKQ